MADSLHTREQAPATRVGWLCPTDADRARLIDMSPAVKQARRRVALCAGIGVIAISPWEGWHPVALFLLAPGPLLLMDRWMDRTRRPERISAAVMALNFLLILAGAALTGGVRSPLLPWVALPVSAAAARFRPLVFFSAAITTALLTIGVLFAVSAHALLRDPAPVISVVVLLAGLVVLQQPVLDAETRWRKDAVLDTLTGLLNRQGLDRRFAELAEQARLLDVPVSLVLFDVDRFKDVNDTHGHARGDDVLTAVADILRRQLRSFELLYRLGGDELLLLLPGTMQSDAMRIAEQARLAVQASRPAGLDVTVSIGVCSATGRDITLIDMFAAADRSLYEAKRAGRNAVCESTVMAPAVPVPAV